MERRQKVGVGATPINQANAGGAPGTALRLRWLSGSLAGNGEAQLLTPPLGLPPSSSGRAKESAFLTRSS